MTEEQKELQELWKEACSLANKTIRKLEGRPYVLAQFYLGALMTTILSTHPSINNRDEAQLGLVEIMQSTMKVLDRHYGEESLEEKLVKERLFEQLAALYDVQDQKPN